MHPKSQTQSRAQNPGIWCSSSSKLSSPFPRTPRASSGSSFSLSGQTLLDLMHFPDLGDRKMSSSPIGKTTSKFRRIRICWARPEYEAKWRLNIGWMVNLGEICNFLVKFPSLYKHFIENISVQFAKTRLRLDQTNSPASAGTTRQKARN